MFTAVLRMSSTRGGHCGECSVNNVLMRRDESYD
jgi:hypothetical protein